MPTEMATHLAALLRQLYEAGVAMSSTTLAPFIRRVSKEHGVEWDPLGRTLWGGVGKAVLARRLRTSPTHIRR